MKVQITNAGSKLLYYRGEVLDAVSVSFSPNRRYAVIELYRGELFVAAKVIEDAPGLLTGEYVNHSYFPCDVPMQTKFRVDWSNICYGFCKLKVWAPEMVNDFGGSFSDTTDRFYLDWELYKECYERLHGVPCTKKNPNA